MIRSRHLVRTKSDSDAEASRRRPKSPESDNEKKKFFQSILQGKSASSEKIGPIPEEKESTDEAPKSSKETETSENHAGASEANGDAPALPVTEKTPAADEKNGSTEAEGSEGDDSVARAEDSAQNEKNQVEDTENVANDSHLEIKSESSSEENNQVAVSSEEASKENIDNQEGGEVTDGIAQDVSDDTKEKPVPEIENKEEDKERSVTGVGSDVRGNEVADSRHEDLPKNVPGHPVRVDSPQKELEEKVENDNKESESSTDDKDKETEDKREEKDMETISEGVVKQDDSSSVSTPKESETAEGLDKSSKEESEEQSATESDTSKANPEGPSHMENGELLAEERAKDQDSSLSVTMKSSFIGAAGSSSENDNEAANDSPRGETNTETQSKENAVTDDEASGASQGAQSPEPSGSTSESPCTSAQGSPSRNMDTTAASPEEASQYRAYVNIPEFLWSPMHQRLLGDLLFAIESDLQVWRR